MNLYNDIELYVCDWAENLIAAGEIPAGRVDRRPIQELKGRHFDGFTQIHLFSGCAGWTLALRLAGWPDDRPIWSCSCPCQPYSGAGKGLGDADARNLWPEAFRLIQECRPAVIFGEQVAGREVVGTRLEAAFVAAVRAGNTANANELAERIAEREEEQNLEELGLRWIDGISADLEGAGYTFGAAVLGAHSVGAPHIRQRLYWVAYSRRELRPRPRQGDGLDSPERLQPGIDADTDGVLCGMGDAGVGELRDAGREAVDGAPTGVSGATRKQRIRVDAGPAGDSTDPWSNFRIVHCLDGKARRIGRGTPALASGLPRSLGPGSARSDRLRLLAAKANRVGRIRGYGNSICPHLAAAFIEEAMAAIAETAGAAC